MIFFPNVFVRPSLFSPSKPGLNIETIKDREGLLGLREGCEAQSDLYIRATPV